MKYRNGLTIDQKTKNIFFGEKNAKEGQLYKLRRGFKILYRLGIWYATALYAAQQD